MFDGADAVCGQTDRDGFAQNFGRERANLQIRLPTAARFVVRVADIVTKMRLFAVDGAYTGHNSLAGIRPEPSTIVTFRDQSRGGGFIRART